MSMLVRMPSFKLLWLVLSMAYCFARPEVSHFVDHFQRPHAVGLDRGELERVSHENVAGVGDEADKVQVCRRVGLVNVSVHFLSDHVVRVRPQHEGFVANNAIYLALQVYVVCHALVVVELEEAVDGLASDQLSSHSSGSTFSVGVVLGFQELGDFVEQEAFPSSARTHHHNVEKLLVFEMFLDIVIDF